MRFSNSSRAAPLSANENSATQGAQAEEGYRGGFGNCDGGKVAGEGNIVGFDGAVETRTDQCTVDVAVAGRDVSLRSQDTAEERKAVHVERRDV